MRRASEERLLPGSRRRRLFLAPLRDRYGLPVVIRPCNKRRITNGPVKTGPHRLAWRLFIVFVRRPRRCGATALVYARASSCAPNNGSLPAPCVCARALSSDHRVGFFPSPATSSSSSSFFPFQRRCRLFTPRQTSVVALVPYTPATIPPTTPRQRVYRTDAHRRLSVFAVYDGRS